MEHERLYDFTARETSTRSDAREHLTKEGPAALSDEELLAALLGTGTRGKGVRILAAEVLELIDASRTVPESSLLQRLPGIGEAKACAIVAALELGRRLYGLREPRIASPRDVWPLISHWADRKQERFICCSLNGAHEVMASRVVSIGLVNRTVVDPFYNKYYWTVPGRYFPFASSHSLAHSTA